MKVYHSGKISKGCLHVSFLLSDGPSVNLSSAQWKFSTYVVMNCHFIQKYSNYSVFTTMIYGAQVIITITKKFLLFTNKIEEYVRPPDLSSPLCATDCSPKIALKSSIPKIQGFCCTQKETRLVEFELGRDR